MRIYNFNSSISQVCTKYDFQIFKGKYGSQKKKNNYRMTNHMFIILQTNVTVYHISVLHNLVMYFDEALSNCWIGRGGIHDLLTNSI